MLTFLKQKSQSISRLHERVFFPRLGQMVKVRWLYWIFEKFI